MPAVSFHLSQEVLETVKARAKAVNVPVSRIIREAVENYFGVDEQKEARERVFKTLSQKRPLGGSKGWEGTHQERTSADVDRG